MPNLIQLKFSKKQLYRLTAIILLLNISMLVATYFLYFLFYQGPQNSTLVSNLSYFNLAQENTFGTCYSAWLLLSVAIVAVLCFVADKQHYHHQPGHYLSYGWLFLSGVFSMLSLDEVGSFHERIGNNATFNLFGQEADWYLFLAAIYAVTVFMLFFCWKRLRSNLRATTLMIIGLVLFVSLRFQEDYEMAHYSFKRPIMFILLEEGSEIFGTFCFLIAMTLSLIYLQNKKGNFPKNSLIDLNFTLNPKLALVSTFAFLILLAVCQIFIIIYFKNFALADKGIPENWFPGVTAFLGATLSLFIYYNKTETTISKPVIYLLAGLFCLIISFVYGSNFYVTYFYSTGWLPLIIKVLMGGSTIGLAIGLMKQTKSFWNRAGVSTWMILFSLSLTINSSYFAKIGFVAFSGLLLALIYHVYLLQNPANRIVNTNQSSPRVATLS